MKSDDEILSEDSAGIDRGALLRRVALGGAAASLPALAGAQAAFGASNATEATRRTRAGSSRSSTT